MTEKIPGWLERVLLPRLTVMEGDIKAIYAKIEGLDQKIDSVDAKLSAKIDAVDEKLTAKIDDLDKRLSGNDTHLADKIDGLDKKLDVVQRLTVLETKMEELQPKA